jgi:hypothetical protein
MFLFSVVPCFVSLLKVIKLLKELFVQVGIFSLINKFVCCEFYEYRLLTQQLHFQCSPPCLYVLRRFFNNAIINKCNFVQNISGSNDNSH